MKIKKSFSNNLYLSSHINIYSDNTQKYKSVANTHNKQKKICQNPGGNTLIVFCRFLPILHLYSTLGIFVTYNLYIQRLLHFQVYMGEANKVNK